MTTQPLSDPFGARDRVDLGSGPEYIYRLDRLEKTGVASNLARLPYSIRILLEAVLRTCDGFAVTEEDVRQLAGWNATSPAPVELPFQPARVLLQDFSGVPCLVDLAAMRSAMRRLGGDPRRINPLVPVDLVIDHSVQVDVFGTTFALARNAEMEFQRNRERYQFLRWGQQALQNFRVVPPATGIVHQVNLEYLARVVISDYLVPDTQYPSAFPDTLVGTDSHTTMVNGLGVLAWGVGGIEAEAVMLGQPLSFLTPQVVGCKLSGQLRDGVTATDLVLTVTQMLRQKGVVEKFVEFYGPGLASISLPDRATIANMAPEYGATCGFFPVDAETLSYLRRTGRSEADVTRVERYCQEQGLFRTDDSPEPVFSDTLFLDLSTVEASLAGPRRPQDRVALGEVKRSFQVAFGGSHQSSVVSDQLSANKAQSSLPDLCDGDVVIAAITSCTNTSNPAVMLAAGLVAKKAVEKGLKVKPYVKTSLAPGSKVVTEYLQATGLLAYLEQLGFHLVGYGCTTCIGNSGPLPEPVARAIREKNLVAAAVISGNRNFEGRVHPLVKANYLASPPLVVAYALAGSVLRDLTSEPLGSGKNGQPVYLRDVWPTPAEIAAVLPTISPEMFRRTYADVFQGNPQWNQIAGEASDLYPWDATSTYILEPPFFQDFTPQPTPIQPITNARILALFGDSITTDHISPAGDIEESSPAGQYLIAHGVTKADFNSYGSRRGNHEVLMRATFANIRIKNLLLGGQEGGYTCHFPSGEKMTIYDAAMRYKAEGVPLVVLAGKEYGTGSSRDWAAKGPLLLGVRAVIAQSFERIHRANLVGMGVLPLQFQAGESIASLGLTGREQITIQGLSDSIQPRQELTIVAQREDGTTFRFNAVARLDTPVEVLYYRHGGILPTVLRNLLSR